MEIQRGYKAAPFSSISVENNSIYQNYMSVFAHLHFSRKGNVFLAECRATSQYLHLKQQNRYFKLGNAARFFSAVLPLMGKFSAEECFGKQSVY